MNIENTNPMLAKPVDKTTPTKEWLVEYVGTQHEPNDGDVTVEMIIETMAKEFPEFLMALAEENWIRGYHQALSDVTEGDMSYNSELKARQKMDQLTDYIKKSLIASENTRREYQLFDDIFVYVKDQLPDNINLSNVLMSVERIIPYSLSREVDGMYIGQFQEWGDREVNSMFKDASIFVTNEQDDDEDMIDDIVHEFAHSVEGPMGAIIYSDGKLQQEFVGKRKRLYFLLKAEEYDVTSEKFMNSEYEEKFDDFLYKKIGYDVLSSIAMGLFITPYAITSLREYFATGYTEYLMGDRNYLMKVSPMLYRKWNN